MARGLYTLKVDNTALRVMLNTAKLNLSPAQLDHLGLAMRDTAIRAQARAVRNVSGYPVQYDGKVFRVVVRTGTLKGAIEMQWPYQSALQARVFVNGSHTAQPIKMGDGYVRPRPVADYAAAIEFGHGPIDLKQYMRGKTVPFFASRSANTTGPFSVRGLTPVSGPQDLWENKKFNEQLAAQGKNPMRFQRRKAKAYDGGKHGGGTYFITFRKVGDKGWIVPAAKERPFMRAAATGAQAQKDARRYTRERLIEILTPSANARRSR